jgi:hypothetical protein
MTAAAAGAAPAGVGFDRPGSGSVLPGSVAAAASNVGAAAYKIPGVLNYGDAAFYGSPANVTLSAPIGVMATTPSGKGYWLVAADGGVLAYGDAVFRGSAGGINLYAPIVGMAPTPSGKGYWLVALDGGIFTFGDAAFYGSTGAVKLNSPIVGMASTADGKGYWLTAADGGIFTFGDAAFFGSAGSIPLAAPIVGMASAPRHHGAQVIAFYYPWWGNPTFDGQWVHWDEGGNEPPWDIGADFYPSRDPYSSADPNVLDAQFAEIAAAGIDEVIVSWWGQGSYEDTHLPGVTAAATAHGVKVGIHLEPYGVRTVDSVQNDIKRLQSQGYSDFWIYEAMQLPGDQLQSVIDGAGNVRVMAETGNITSVRNGTFTTWAQNAHFTGIYAYDPVRYVPAEFNGICGGARMHSLLCVPVTAPGFQAMRSSAGANTIVVPRNNGATYDAKWQGAITAQPDVIAITSYNEWHEGSQIEPAKGGCFGANVCYLNYEGAYGQSGDAAASAYMGRTKFWTDRYHASAS